MKRWLEINIRYDIVLGISRKEFYRIAAKNALITDVQKWWEFHAARNRTSHVYDEAEPLMFWKQCFNFSLMRKVFSCLLKKNYDMCFQT